MAKRSIAILGPTPSFVRWAIDYPCSLRDIYPARLPETTFRQLRGIREWSIAKLEDRLIDQFCLHPDADREPQSEVRGFPVDEIVAFHGGQDTVESACNQCPANAIRRSQPGVLAGCYGWLPVDLSFRFESIVRGEPTPQTGSPPVDRAPSLIDLFELAIEDAGLADQVEKEFLKTTPAWYGFWNRSVLSHRQLEVLQTLAGHVVDRQHSEIASTDSEILDLIRFRNAIRTCRENEFPLHVELIPPGNSDGQHWILEAHCGMCKSPSGRHSKRCLVCGTVGHRQNETKLKVLGVRPYLNLESILGCQATTELLGRYRSRIRKHDLNA